MVKIVQDGNPVLREVSKNVPHDEIGTRNINKIIKNMKKALATQDDGVAIAAPQIGILLRIFIVSGKVLDAIEDGEPDNIKRNIPAKNDDVVFINPKISKISKKKNTLEEGCLSVMGFYGDVRRSTNATVEAYNENGEKFTRGAGGLLAQIFQHEIDHLDGILFVDKAKNVVEIPYKN
jgi:peptide deformylase